MCAVNQHLVIIQITGEHHSLYRLRGSSGVLQRRYRADDLKPFKGDYSISVDGWEVQPIVTLKEAASSSHLGTHSLPINVIANLVPVRVADADAKNEIECSSHCHKRDHCKNKQQDSKIPNQG